MANVKKMTFRAASPAERQATYRARQKRVMRLRNPEVIYRIEVSGYDVSLIQAMLATRMQLSANADAKAEYQDLSRRLDAQTK